MMNITIVWIVIYVSMIKYLHLNMQGLCKCFVCKLNFDNFFFNLKNNRKHVLQEEITSLIFEETNDPNYCNPECLFNQNVRHLHCRMVCLFRFFLKFLSFID